MSGDFLHARWVFGVAEGRLNPFFFSCCRESADRGARETFVPLWIFRSLIAHSNGVDESWNCMWDSLV